MKFSLFIAKRYLFSKKTHNAINIITGISITGVCVGTMALIVVLSVFNGFESLVVSLYNSFDSDIQITPQYGKTFSPSADFYNKIKAIEGVSNMSKVLEENALLKYHDKQYIATIKGIEPEYLQHTGLDTMITDGTMAVQKDSTYFALVGEGVANKLSMNIHDALGVLSIYVPKKGVSISTLNPESAFYNEPITPSGVFAIQQEFDSKYVIVSYAFAKNLLNYSSEISSLEITIDPAFNKEKVQEKIQVIAGNNLIVKNRFQQHETMYKIMRSEKWAVFLILGFILIIATFNVIGSLTMLIIEKKKDASILLSMGATETTVRKIFLLEGMLISLLGAVTGIILGTIICISQMQYGIIKMPGGGSFVIDSYPVKMEAMDFIYVFLTVITIGFIAAWYPSNKLIRNKVNFQLES